VRVLIQIRVDYQRLLLEQLDLIDQLVRAIGRRRHLSSPEQDDFAGFVRLVGAIHSVREPRNRPVSSARRWSVREDPRRRGLLFASTSVLFACVNITRRVP